MLPSSQQWGYQHCISKIAVSTVQHIHTLPHYTFAYMKGHDAPCQSERHVFDGSHLKEGRVLQEKVATMVALLPMRVRHPLDKRFLS